MGNNIVSIIVPVYNAEKSIRRCIDSILEQSYNDTEIVLVDDGSTDSSGMICDDYQKKDNRVRAIHTTNHGVSHARNVGIAESSGEFITFVDSDDHIAPTFLENYMQYKDFELVAGGYQTFPQHHQMTFQDNSYCISKGDASRLSPMVARLDGSCWAKLFRSNIIKNNNLWFDESMKFSEDTLFSVKYMYYIDTLKTISDTGYHYYVQSNTPAEFKYNFNKQILDSILGKLLDAYQQLEHKWRTEINHSNFRIGVACFPVQHIYDNMSDDDYYDLYYKYFYQADKEQFYKDSICSPYIRTITAIKAYLSIGNKKQARAIMKGCHKLYGDRIKTINYPYPLYSTIAKLISSHHFKTAEVVFLAYNKLKELRNKVGR